MTIPLVSRYGARAALTLLLTATVGLSLQAQEPAPKHALPLAPAAQTLTAYTLGDCLDLAMQRQPRIMAARASLAAAEDGHRALEALCVPQFMSPDLPLRRKQSCLGVQSAAAGVDQAERETKYAVIRTYFTVILARDQERVAGSVVERLDAVQSAAKKKLDAGDKDAVATDVDKASVYLRLAKTKLIQAEQGSKRALIALREAIGLGYDCPLEIAPGRLVEPNVLPNKDEVVASALSRRAEAVRASVFADVACLEVEVQGTGVHKKFETFAAGSDIHSIPVPLGSNDTDYRPGGLLPEYPTLLAGARGDRVKHAQSLLCRARAVVEVARGLIALEAEDAFLRWEEAARATQETREAAETGDRTAIDLDKQYRANLKVRPEEVINARVLAATARSEYNTFVYKQIIALADLERATAGGFCPRLADLANTQPVAAQKPANPK